ncbi:Hypothetical predicted protein [Mytilus galloprovincialis]|uniref:Uncharacterized protein n=1 Tax=Mytilus galloprovincialis TaxID=29158 RepID=A0A8B6H2A1_MYTGA|nr:Hypothetical predicted protein [Mytilus galloprovincialis]
MSFQNIRHVILVELIAHERKLAKYQELVTDIKEKNLRIWSFPVEVGCRDFVSQTFQRTFGSLELTGPVRRSLLGNVWETGRGSFWLGLEEERRAVEELAGSWLSLINSVGTPPGDCLRQRRNIRGESDDGII